MANSSSSSEFRTKWSEPADIFSLLLLLGGDVIQTALASPQTPVAFSFGWVAYAVTAMLASIGNASRPPSPRERSWVVNLRNGWTEPNGSWLIGQVVEHYDVWIPSEVVAAMQTPKTFRDEEEKVRPAEERGAPFSVAVYKWSFDGAGIPRRDWVWWSGPLTTIFQLGISAIPFVLYNYWGVFLTTVCGTVLSYVLSILPTRIQLSRRYPNRNVALTNGNGSRHVIIILGDDGGLDIPDIARNYTPNPPLIKLFKFVLGVLWIALLITSTGIKTHTWYLLAVGGIGMAQNLLLAGMPRHPDALGIPLKLERREMTEPAMPGQLHHEKLLVFAEQKVMYTLMELELEFKGFGKSLLEIFFPGGLKAWEEKWWASHDRSQRIRLLEDMKREELHMKALAR